MVTECLVVIGAMCGILWEIGHGAKSYLRVCVEGGGGGLVIRTPLLKGQCLTIIKRYHEIHEISYSLAIRF